MISPRLKNVILRTLDLKDCSINDETTADQVPGWDSLNHINVILSIEREYKIRLKGHEVFKLKNIGDLQKLVDSKLV